MGNEVSASGALNPEAFQRLAELASVALLAHREGRVVWANAAAAHLAGYPCPTALIGRSVLDFVQPENRAEVTAGLERAARGEGQTYRQTFQRADGSTLDAELQRVPLGEGLTLVVARSLEPERLQRAAELRARAFFDASTAALGISRLGVHVEVNLAYARLFGFDDPQELVGVPILDLIDPSEHERIRDNVRRRAQGEPVEESYDALARRRDGSSFMMGVKVSSYRDGSDTITLVVVRDVTAEKAAEAQVRHRERLEAIGRLAGGVAHDFNNILAAILANAELSLLTVPADTSLHHNLSVIRDATQRARNLVSQILTFGRRDRGNAIALDPVQVIGEALTLARAGIPASTHVDVVLQPISGSVVADPVHLHQIVLNLLSNAADAVAGRGRIEVRLEPATLRDAGATGARWLKLQVRDDGPGIDAGTRAHLFEPYVTTKAAAGGHGLGLAVVHGIVTSLGGVIRVESQKGHGAAFDVYLPVSDEPVLRPTPVPDRPQAQGHVLVVDDEKLVRRAIARLTESLGYQVTEAESGAAALALVRAKPAAYDIVLSDITMPEMTGPELARSLAREFPGQRVVLCTGYSSVPLDGNISALGVRALLYKPVAREDLAAALHQALTGE
ncbi:MAG: PAS domain S-box protein [Myxococcaceae bacterium]|nr:PAS domain S-box protein [Myxococcaceae bacterium]